MAPSTVHEIANLLDYENRQTNATKYSFLVNIFILAKADHSIAKKLVNVLNKIIKKYNGTSSKHVVKPLYQKLQKMKLKNRAKYFIDSVIHFTKNDIHDISKLLTTNSITLLTFLVDGIENAEHTDQFFTLSFQHQLDKMQPQQIVISQKIGQ